MNKIQGKDRRKIKTSIKAAEYQEKKFGICEVRNKRIKELKQALKEKLN